jgi:hypothetical protein
MIWNTDSSLAASRPATAITTISVSQPAIQPAARVVRLLKRDCINGSIAQRLSLDFRRLRESCFVAPPEKKRQERLVQP